MASRIGSVVGSAVERARAERDHKATSWRSLARPEQLPPPGDWNIWAYIAGRGAGKTRAGAEWVHEQVAAGYTRIALVAPTAADARDVMVEGESGILATAPPATRPLYEPSKRRVTWPDGAIATTFSADEPERLRGPQHDLAWCDELGAWRYPEAWDMLMFGLRIPPDPRALITTTPRPTKLMRDVLALPATAITRGTTYDNLANLAPAFVDRIVARYEGTRLGRQELMAEMLEDVEGALWTRAMLDDSRITKGGSIPAMSRVVVAVDPAVTSGEDSDETGIVVVAKGEDGHGYIFEDLTCRASPDGWARRLVKAYHDNSADRIVAEVNNGGDMVEHLVRTVDPAVSYEAVRATRGKVVRAEPVAALYEQGRVHHVGAFPELEDQMCAMTLDGYEGGSPDRVDALVWALTSLMLTGGAPNVRWL